MCDALACTPDDLMTPIVADTLTRTGTADPAGDAGPRLGSIRPIRATVRRPNEE